MFSKRSARRLECIRCLFQRIGEYNVCFSENDNSCDAASVHHFKDHIVETVALLNLATGENFD